MKIAFDVQILFEKEKTGIGRMTDYLIHSMIREYSEEFVFYYFRVRKERKRKEWLLAYQEYRNLRIQPCRWVYAFLYRWGARVFRLPYRWFFGKGADITQFFHYSVPYGVAGKTAVFIYDMAYRVYPETIQAENLKMLYREVEVASRRADRIITISEFSKAEIVKYLGVREEKIAVVPCGVDETVFHTGYSEEQIERICRKYRIVRPYFLYLGTLEPRKNVEGLVAAYVQLRKRNRDGMVPDLVIAGKKGWNFERIFELVLEGGIEEAVIFTGYIESFEIPLLLSGAVGFVFPSFYEGFGMPPLEAMACGVPVISSKVSSIPEVVGDAGILVNPLDREELREAMEKLILDRELREALRRKGLERSRHFRWKRSAELLMKVYAELAEEKGD